MHQVLGSDWIYQLGYYLHHASSIPLGLWRFCPLLGAVSLHLCIGPPTQGHLWFFIQHGKCLGILQFIPTWIILQCIFYTSLTMFLNIAQEPSF